MKRYIYIVIAIALMVPAVFYVGSTFAWYIIEDEGSAVGIDVGILQVEITYDSKVQDTNEFVVENTGTLPAYVRIGYTFIYRDDQGNDLINDISRVTAGEWKLSLEGVDLPLEHITVPRAAGTKIYDKPFVFPCDPVEDEYYYKLLPGEKLNGYCEVDLKEQPKAGETLHVIWVAEALQTGKKVVEQAAVYGWNPAKAQLSA